MSNSDDDIARIDLEAAQWVVRGQGPNFRDEDFVRLSAWLGSSKRHVESYDRALKLWASMDEFSFVEEDKKLKTAIVLPFRNRRSTFATYTWAGGIAAGVAVLLSLAFVMNRPPLVETFQTQKGSRQTIKLSDGSVLSLNTDSKIRVEMGHGSRKFTLDQGEVALAVVHDETRPLSLTAGDTRISDLGTEFDVLRQQDVVKVAVKEGSLYLNGSVLRAGDSASHTDGEQNIQLQSGQIEEAFAWKSAHAIYHDQPLSVVVKDLNRYFDKPLIVDERSGRLKLTAILTLDSETSVVERLQDFLSLKATTTPQGIYLSEGSLGQHQPGGLASSR